MSYSRFYSFFRSKSYKEPEVLANFGIPLSTNDGIWVVHDTLEEGSILLIYLWI